MNRIEEFVIQRELFLAWNRTPKFCLKDSDILKFPKIQWDLSKVASR